jgi:2'-5' RNA ligase
MLDQPSKAAPMTDPAATRRLFYALPLQPQTVEHLASLMKRLQGAARFTPATIKWVEPRNLHATLHFLGSVEEEKLEALRHAAREVARRTPPFELRLHGLGYFPSIRQPRVLWVGMPSPPKELVRLVDSLGQSIVATGVELQHQEFHAHVTLARFDALRGTGAFASTAASQAKYSTTRSMADRLVLYESVLGPDGPTYTELEVASLDGGVPFQGV